MHKALNPQIPSKPIFLLKHIAGKFLKSFFKHFPWIRCFYDYWRVFHTIPNIIFPKTFNEKILHKMFFDRNPRLTLFADKFLVRDFVKSRLASDEHLPKLYYAINDPFKISTLMLPKRFVMKPNHLSGSIKIIRDFKEPDIKELETLAEEWLKINFFYSHYEWAYKNIKPLILFEELLESEGEIPDDWKFFCFNGQPRFIQVDKDRLTKHKRNFYDLNLSLLPVKAIYDNFENTNLPPENFNKMIEIAKLLSKDLDFIRVDLYNIKGRVLFGELTNYHGASLEKFVPVKWDIEFGSYWK